MLESAKKVVVTGGAGFIGRRLANALVAMGKEVTVVDDLSAACDKSVPRGAILALTDLADARQTREALEGADLVFHLGANENAAASVNDPRDDFETNALGTFNVLEASLKAGAKRLVYASSAAVYGRPRRCPVDEEHPLDPFVPVGASKLSGELCALAFERTYGLQTAAARLFSVYGPGEDPRRSPVEVSRYLRWHLGGSPIQVAGEPRKKSRDYLQVEDAVEALLLIADKAPSGEIYNVGTGVETTLEDLVEVIGTVTGRRPKAVTADSADSFRLVADVSRLKALKWRPKISLEQGIRQLSEALSA